MMRTRIIHIVRAFFDLLAPRACAACGAPGSLFCAPCQGRIAPVTLSCIICGKRAPNGALCTGLCRTHLTPDKKSCGLAQVIAAGSFTSPLREAIVAFKYGKQRELRATLAIHMRHAAARHIGPLDPQTHLITFIPLGSERLQKRKYDQSEELAIALAAETGLPTMPLLVRKPGTAAQTQVKTKKDRERNMHHAFTLTPAEILPGKTLIIVDDVATTGATLVNAAHTLRLLRPKKMVGLVVARKFPYQ